MSIPIYWIVCKLLLWEKCEWESNYMPFPGCVGFLEAYEAYDDYDKAIEAAVGDNSLVVAIRHKEQTGGAGHE